MDDRLKRISAIFDEGKKNGTSTERLRTIVLGLFTDEIQKSEVRECVEKILPTLTPRQEHVIRLRFGLKEKKCHTFEEIGETYAVTRNRIRQICATAVLRICDPERFGRRSFP